MKQYAMNFKLEKDVIQGQQLNKGRSVPLHMSQEQILKEGGALQIPPVTLVMPKESFKQLANFKPFLENSTPQQKLDFLGMTSIIKPKKRVKKLQAKLKKAQKIMSEK